MLDRYWLHEQVSLHPGSEQFVSSKQGIKVTRALIYFLPVQHMVFMFIAIILLRSAVAGRLYKHQSKHTSNSGFDRSFMPCSGYILFAAEQRVGYQISWVDLQREVNCP